MPVRVAALLTSHNRVTQTVSCLDALAAQDNDRVVTRRFLVDAGSTDGTPETVAREFPDVELVRRGPDLYWAGGMRVAQAAAWRADVSHFLWLNDDTLLDPGALDTLLDTEDEVRGGTSSSPPIVAGATRDPDSGEVTYGGLHRPSAWRRLHFERIGPRPHPVLCETMNGNCVLVPRDVASRVGNLDPAFTHGMGDLDYGLRARVAGCEVWQAPGTVATCRNEPWRPSRSPAGEWRRLTGPKGLPWREWFTFARRWAGPAWPIYALSPYLRRLARAALGDSGRRSS